MSRTDVDALARLLDGDPTVNGEAGEQIHALGTLARTLHAAAVRPAPAFAADLRAHLLEEARAQSLRPPFLTRLRRQFRRVAARWRYSVRLAAVSGVATLALSGGAVATAAERSLPSDPLYGVKLALEDVRLALTADGAARGTQRLAYAVERLEDTRREAETGDFRGAAGGLWEADESARSGARDLIRASQQRHDRLLLEVLQNFTRLQRQRLAALAPLLAGPADEAAQQALVALERIDERLAVLHGGCGGCGETAATARDGAFDFAEIPPAAAPFVACPCASAKTGRGQPRGGDDSDDPSPRQAREHPGRQAEAGARGRPRSSPAAPPQQPSPTAPSQQPPPGPSSQPPPGDTDRESADEPPTTAGKRPTITGRPPVLGGDAGSDATTTTTTLQPPPGTLQMPPDGDAQSGDPVQEVVEDAVDDVLDAPSAEQPADGPQLPIPSTPAPSVSELASELPDLPDAP